MRNSSWATRLVLACFMSHGLARAESAQGNVEYQSWGARDSGVQLKDDQGQPYQPFSFPAGTEVNGRFARASLAGGHGPVYDVLVFQSPPKERAYLLLALPGSALGLPGSLQFKIPAKAITEGPVLEAGAPLLIPKKTGKR